MFTSWLVENKELELFLEDRCHRALCHATDAVEKFHLFGFLKVGEELQTPNFLSKKALSLTLNYSGDIALEILHFLLNNLPPWLPFGCPYRQ
jgi:hypothetical protein